MQQSLEARLNAAQKVVSRDWDKGFLESLAEQVSKGRTLSPKQIEMLDKIEYRNSPDVLAARERWVAEFSSEQRAIAKVCASYYSANPPYFNDLCRRVLDDDEFIPTEKQYKALCENKYAMKVRAASFDPPVFPVGSLVALRSSAPAWVKKHCVSGQNLAVVVSAGALPVVSHARGSKQYEILPVGASAKIAIEERHLKKMRQSKKKKK